MLTINHRILGENMFRPTLISYTANCPKLISRTGIRAVRWQPSRNVSFLSSSTSLSLKQRLLEHPTRSWNRIHAVGLTGATIAGGLGLAAAMYKQQVVQCDAPGPEDLRAAPLDENAHFTSPPSSAVRLYEMSFGSVCGVCAGVFLKKGVKIIAFFFGGTFVLLQTFVSARLIKIDWKHAENKFAEYFYVKTTDESGTVVRKPPTIAIIWNYLVNFLTADFQPRAAFLAGFALGLRIG